MRINDQGKFASGIGKVIVGVAMLLGGMFVTNRGCTDVQESINWTDESGESITDELNQVVEISDYE